MKYAIFKKRFEKFSLGGKDSYKQEEIKPNRDWKIIFVLFILLSLSGVIFNVYTYFTINKTGFSVSAGKDDLPIESINRSDLAKVVDFYEAKDKAFQELKNKKPEAVIDPSL